MRKAIWFILLLFLVAKANYDSRCLDVKYAGSIPTIHGVYCWRRINDSFDNFKRLDELEATREKPDTFIIRKVGL